MVKFRAGTSRFYFGFLLNSPFIIAWKLGLVSNQFAKERVMQYFFGKMECQKFAALCEAFAREALPSMIRPKALKEIAQLQATGTEVVIVSASPEDWLKPWCRQLNTTLISTKLEVRNDRITGRILGFNCHGEEKVRRIREVYDLSRYNEIYCYGDTQGDKPMLSLANISFYRPFR